MGYSSCKQPGGQQENFSFNPKPAVVYKLNIIKKTKQQWLYKEKWLYALDSIQTDYDFQLLRKTDTAFLLKLQFENFMKEGHNVKINTNAQSASLPEANINPHLLYDYLLHFAKGQYITVWMNKKGRPILVNGIGRLVDSVAKISGVPENITRKYLEDFISEAVIKDELNQLFCFIPDRPKLMGQSWVENIMLSAKAPVKWSTDFKLRYNKKDTAAIECNSYITARQGEDGRTYMKGKLTGNIVAGYSTGIPYKWIAKSETITTTDNYDITTIELLTATITAEKP